MDSCAQVAHSQTEGPAYLVSVCFEDACELH